MRIHNTIVAASVASAASAVPSAISVRIDTQPQQTLTSFGASGAWWPNDLINFPTAVQEKLAKFLFSNSGLHLSSYRYNMGGDGGNDSKIVTNPTNIVESFLLTNGTYDWNRDAAGVSFLKKAQEYSVPYITFFVNAAPSHIATNGAACGWDFTRNKTVEYSKYIATVLSHWVTNGIDNLKYISPMNEPDNNRADCSQEGMAVAPSLRAHIIKSIRKAMNKSPAAKVGIIADETSQITTQAFPEDPIWLPKAAPAMHNIAVHNYDYPDDASLAEYYQSIRNLTTTADFPPVKFTETCCSTNAGYGSGVFGAQYDPTMANALIVGRYVWQFLAIVQAESFDWWTAVADLPCSPSVDGQQCATAINETAGYNSGLIYIDGNYNQTKDYNLYTTKRAYLLKHLAYFHRPGSVRYDVPQTQFPDGVVAIASKLNDIWSVLFMNNQTHAYNLNLHAPAKKLARLVETTNAEDFADVRPLPSVKNGVAKISLPALSFVTVQFSP